MKSGGYAWATGRMGYGKHIYENTAGINLKRLDPPKKSKIELFREQVELFLKMGYRKIAFDLVCDCEFLTEHQKLVFCKKWFKEFKDIEC